MRAVVFAGDGRVRVDDVAEPKLVEPGDALVRVDISSICGSDLHLLTGKTPGLRPGSVIGHEFVGRVTEVAEGANVDAGDRVVGSFLIACGSCDPCAAGRFNFCSDRRALGTGELTGDLDGAQAEYVRVPVADVNLRRIVDSLSDERALFCGDILATGFHGADLTEAGDRDIAVIVGAGPVGLLSALAVARRGARTVVVDTNAKRANWAAANLGLEVVAGAEHPEEAITNLTGGSKADVAIDAVGAIPALKTAMRCVREGGRVVVLGVYGAERMDLAMGRAWVSGLDLRFAGMANVQGHWAEALDAVGAGEIDPTALITHRMSLDDAEEGYELFASQEAMKVVLTP
ncbi:MAG: alcohol dehydrogenase catalytic domain-containing protein [Actinomycetota bacterium]